MTKTELRIKASTAPGAEAINQAYHEWRGASQDANYKAILCGQMLRECRDAKNLCHGGTGEGLDYSQFDPNKPDGSKFGVWLLAHCPQIPRRTAYRWMDIAEKIMSFLELRPGESGSLYLALVKPTSPEREALLQYISGKTMADCLAGIILEGDETHRLTRAQNGMEKGGTRGEDRKDWPLFVARKFRDISSCIGLEAMAQ